MPRLPFFLVAALAACFSSSAPAADTLPPDSAYISVDADGHFVLDGQRQRYWAVIGKPYQGSDIKAEDDAATRADKLARSREGTSKLLDRFTALGFNAVRLWDVTTNEDYAVGDGSHADAVDFFLSECSKRGFRVWAAGLGNRVGSVNDSDVDIIDEPATRDAWLEAIKTYQGINVGGKKGSTTDLRHSLARHWDSRLEALYIERMRANANHLNKHTGLRWADDPVFVVWELTNEEWWMRKMVGGSWRKEPAHFRNALLEKWQHFLRNKYANEAALTTAWNSLLPGESLTEGSIALLPMAGKTDPKLSMNDANPHARAALEGMTEEYSREDFARQRGHDVIEFFIGIQLGHKKRCAAVVKAFGKSVQHGVVIHDTGIGYEIQSQYIHQEAEAVAHDAYVNGWGPQYEAPDLESAKNDVMKMLRQLDAERISANDGIWMNWLKKPPGISQGVPWLEHNRVKGKPYLVYETQIQQPAKYRADFPLRLAALASIQDWDWISWHYFAAGDVTKDKPFEKKLDVTSGKHPQGYHFTYDEVQNALMRQAGLLFRNQNLDPAPNPTTFIFGKKSLTDPDSMDYAGSYGPSGMDMFQTTYQYGVRIQIDPSRDDDEVIGPVVSFAERTTHNPYTPTKAITFDWKKGYLLFDDPRSVAFAGELAKYGEHVTFGNGVVLKDVSINNPAGIYSPVTDDSKYIAFSLTADDGLPLAESKRMSLAIMSTSFNTDFSVKEDEVTRNINHKVNAGTTPVLVARVGATITAPFLTGATYTFLDWNLDTIGTGTISDGALVIPNDQPIFQVMITR